MEWFDTEHTNLLAAQQSAQHHGWDDPVHRLAGALDPYHRRRGRIEAQVTVWRLAVAAAQSLPDQTLRLQAHQMLGDACAQLGKTADALHFLYEALALSEQADDSIRGEIHHSLGGAWERHGDSRRALEHAQHALLIFQALDDTYRHARVLNGVGWLQAHLGDYPEARANCESALALLRQLPLDDRGLGESDILDSLGFIAHRCHEYDRALEHYRQALAICRAQGHSYLEPDILAHIAETHFAQYNIDQAQDTWRRALELYAAQHRVTDVSRVQQMLETLVA
jgi:tetratricopeptide (TPR) repeat protein